MQQPFSDFLKILHLQLSIDQGKHRKKSVTCMHHGLKPSFIFFAIIHVTSFDYIDLSQSDDQFVNEVQNALHI